MARATWTGAISFGLVTIPIKLFAFARENETQAGGFHQYDAADMARIKMPRTNANTGQVVPSERIVRGMEIAPDQIVIVTDDEMAAIAPEASKAIKITRFVDRADIPPALITKTWYVAPNALGEHSYALLALALDGSDRAGIASFVNRSKQHLVALYVHDGAIMMSALSWADEITPSHEIQGLDVDTHTVTAAELEMAGALMDSMAAPFDHGEYRDAYHARVMELVEAKAKGLTLEPAPVETADPMADLMAALEASVAAAKAAQAETKGKRKTKAA